LEQSVVFTWVDRGYGTWADVTMIPYPNLPGEYWPSVAYWWDLEFWNKSIVRSAHFRGQYEWTSGAFPRLFLRFDPTTGAASASPTPYVAQSEKDTRFRIAGIVRTLTSNVFIIEAERPWRAAWKTYGLYGDGWTKPGLDGKVRVFAFPGQEGSVKRALLLAVRAPFELERRPFHVVSNLDEWHADALGEAKVERIVEVCVPAGGYADVRISTPEHSLVYGDMRDQDSFAIPREAGVFLTQIALADEVGGPCEPRTPRR
jgi:hypothetical protein